MASIELNEGERQIRQLLLDVVAFIDDHVVLRIAGGWVRDKLLGITSNDIDVAINSMTGEQFGEKVNEYLEKPGNASKYGPAVSLHKIKANPDKSKHLETAAMNILGREIEFVNLRKEVYAADSRTPQMEFGTPEEDASRRDATINAMFYNLNTDEVEDFTGKGREDMAAKLMRTPLEPYQTFKDDPLRILRLIRFASRLNFKIVPEAEKAMEDAEILEALKIKISRERVGIETEKMLKGPDPHMALALIDRLGLYETIYTDPTREMHSRPDLSWFASAYGFVQSLAVRKADSDIPAVIPDILFNPDERFLAWTCAALMPWADAPTIPHQKATQRPYFAAQLVAREGVKAPNKIVDVITAALLNGEDIRKLVDDCYKQLQRPDAKLGVNATARDTLGMAIRRWGSSWRTQVLWSMIYELVLASVSRERTLKSYATFLERLRDLSLLEAYTIKPIITGGELAKQLDTKPGPWMKDALDIVMAWQLRHPDIKDPATAIDAVRERRNSELSSRLASHFLSLTIRPLFSQTTTKKTGITPAGHRQEVTSQAGVVMPEDTSQATWKDTKNAHVIGLLRWTLKALDAKGVEANWGLLVPPILKMMDDLNIEWKATGCELLTLLLESTPPALLSRTGLGIVFEEELWPLFTYLPTLTPESESVLLLDKTFPALLALLNVLHPTTTEESTSSLSTGKERFLDRLLRDGILAPLFHATPSTYPKLATLLLAHLPELLRKMGINSVKHLQSLLPTLSNMLAEPLGLAHPPLLLAAVRGVQSVILNAWPRIIEHRGEVMRGTCIAWVRCVEELEKEANKDDAHAIQKELKECAAMVEAVLAGDADGWKAWQKEKQELIAASARVCGLFDTDE
ncbi:tRNA nucleotidyltransferase [Polyplosphaeria fusca]|uniref:tRNA nucleotidyltransferase n=1 Tax=Polyplosphaeria fusca TaxID=682080 RepID=A0A9P4V706_9PLEO|nr:tRNA nucleotidyltransferase [Polyplosphaeria fusca]